MWRGFDRERNLFIILASNTLGTIASKFKPFLFFLFIIFFGSDTQGRLRREGLIREGGPIEQVAT